MTHTSSSKNIDNNIDRFWEMFISVPKGLGLPFNIASDISLLDKIPDDSCFDAYGFLSNFFLF